MLKFKHILIILTLNICLKTNAQEVRVIDNKGTFKTVNNNNVTTSNTAPTTPIENDIWFDTSTTPNTIKIYDGSVWKDINPSHTGTTGSVFFAGTDGKPTEDNAQLFWDNTNNRLRIGAPLSGTNKLSVRGVIRATGFNNANGTATLPSYRFSDDSNTGMYRPVADQLGFSTGGVNRLNISNTTVRVSNDLQVDGKFIDSSGDAGTNGQVLSSTAIGTNWIDNPANNNWLITGNAGTTNTNFLGTTDDVKMQIRSNNISILEFGRRQTLGLYQNFPDYRDNNQYLVHVKGQNGVSALQFLANGTLFYKPILFTTPNGSFRLKGSSGRTDFFEIGSGGPDNQGRLEFITGDDGDEPIVFKRYDYRSGEFYKEFFRVQGSDATASAKTRFGININTQNIPTTNDINTNYNTGTFRKANSTFEVNGSVAKSIEEVATAGNFTLTEDHHTVIIKANAPIILPTSTTCKGRIYVIKNISGNTINCSTYKNQSDTNTTIITNNTTIWLQSNGTDWQLINQTSSPQFDFDAATGILYAFDSTRNKWMSVDRTTIPFGKNNNTTNEYLRQINGTPSNTTGWRMMRKGTITGVSVQTENSPTWTLEIRKNNVTIPIVSLNISSANGNHNNNINIDINEGDVIKAYCNGTGVRRPEALIEIAWRK